MYIPKFSEIKVALNLLPEDTQGLPFVKQALNTVLPLTHKPNESIKGCDVYKSYDTNTSSLFNTAITFLILTSNSITSKRFPLQDINDTPPIFQGHLTNIKKTNPHIESFSLDAEILCGTPAKYDHIDDLFISTGITTFNGLPTVIGNLKQQNLGDTYIFDGGCGSSPITHSSPDNDISTNTFSEEDTDLVKLMKDMKQKPTPQNDILQKLIKVPIDTVKKIEAERKSIVSSKE